MAFALITLSASLILNLAVLAMLKVGLRDDAAPTTGDWSGHVPC